MATSRAKETEAAVTEEWRSIPGLEHYEASSLGRIRSLDRTLPWAGRWKVGERRYKGRILKLKPKPNGSGQVYWCFYADGGSYWQVNRAVCFAFHGDPPALDSEAAHLDGDTANNESSNLAWASPTENASHKVLHGTDSAGVRNGRALLSDADVLEIMQRYADGDGSESIAASKGVGVNAIRSVVSGISWSHVASPYREKAKARCRQNMIEASQRSNTARKLRAASR